MLTLGLVGLILTVAPPEKAKTDASADAEVQLALRSEAGGRSDERDTHLKRALSIDPQHPVAHRLLGHVHDGGAWQSPEAVTEHIRQDTELMAVLERYRARRTTLADTANGHWQIARWCVENGLTDEAQVHFAAVIKLAPAREDAWKALGLRKQNGRWTSEERDAAIRAEVDARRKADAYWRPRLSRWKTWLAQRSKRREAEANLVEVVDPEAVPAITGVFAASNPVDQQRAVRLLAQIEGPPASRVLAALAIQSPSAEARRLAVETLVSRDPREFVDLLIDQIRDEIAYEVRPVGGPGSPGELYIKGEKANDRRLYSAPAPTVPFDPSAVIGFDDDGLPIANRVVGYTMESIYTALDPLANGAPDLTGLPQFLAGRGGLGQLGARIGQKAVNQQNETTAMAGALVSNYGGLYVRPLVAPIPIGRMMAQAEQHAVNSRRQLEDDVAWLQDYNRKVIQSNDRAMLALRTLAGQDLGPARAAWVTWWSSRGESTSAAPALRHLAAEGTTDVDGDRNDHSAYVAGLGAGTTVWTRTGPCAIEALRAGDRVLSQDPDTGALGYATILTIRHGVSAPTRTLTLEDRETIVATDLQSFWRPAQGWVRVRDLKPGDRLRLLRGTTRLVLCEPAEDQPVYHVQVRDGRGIFVGKPGILGHDEGNVYPVAAPFDAPADDSTRKSPAPRVRK